MTWTKLSDDFTDDTEHLDDDAFRLHVEGLVWSNRKLLNCLIPKDQLRRFAKHPEAVDKLVEVGWWADAGDHYEIVHHACYQRQREQVVAQQKRSRENGAKGGRPPGPPREQAPRKRNNGTQVGAHVGSDNPDGLATGFIKTVANEQDKTQAGNPVANPEGRAGRSSKGNHLCTATKVYEGPCRNCNQAAALGSDARTHENPSWCDNCNFERADRIRRAQQEP